MPLCKGITRSSPSLVLPWAAVSFCTTHSSSRGMRMEAMLVSLGLDDRPFPKPSVSFGPRIRTVIRHFPSVAPRFRLLDHLPFSLRPFSSVVSAFSSKSFSGVVAVFYSAAPNLHSVGSVALSQVQRREGASAPLRVPSSPSLARMVLGFWPPIQYIAS